MSASRFSQTTISMIYLGTLLLSILSFFTTYLGMTILLDKTLAIIGSLGLQLALLGIAWNLMRLKNNRAYYAMIFLSAAIFSILFSYANFDTTLKANTRQNEARTEYTDAGQPILAEYRTFAQKTAQKGRYQIDRINKLTELERNHGWATIIDEGSNDEFVQSVIDGARISVTSWEKNLGREYRQGRGRGLIVNYFESRASQVEKNVNIINDYINLVDSLSLALNSTLPVEKQHEIINHAWVNFPTGEVSVVMSEELKLQPPPLQSKFVESPANRQQAFLLVIDDLFDMDQLSFFALMLAIVIDLIIILMALGGSQAMANEEIIFDRIKAEATRQIKNLRMEDKEAFEKALNSNIDRFKKACDYNLLMMDASRKYKNNRQKFMIKLKRGEETVAEDQKTIADLEIPRIRTQKLDNKATNIFGTDNNRISEDRKSKMTS